MKFDIYLAPLQTELVSGASYPASEYCRIMETPDDCETVEGTDRGARAAALGVVELWVGMGACVIPTGVPSIGKV